MSFLFVVGGLAIALAMASYFTLSHRQTWTTDDDSTVQDKTVTISADAVEKYSWSVANGQTAFAAAVAFTIANLKGYWLCSDKAVTIKTNDSGAPDDTLVLVANTPITWNNLMQMTKHFTADVDGGFFIANASGATATIEFRVARDSTP